MQTGGQYEEKAIPYSVGSALACPNTDEVTYVPLGSYRSYTALRGDLADRVTGLPPLLGYPPSS